MRKLAPSRHFKTANYQSEHYIPPKGDPVGKSVIHESAVRQVTGNAVYVDDMPEYPDQLHVAVGLSTEAHARIKLLNLDRVRKASGVMDVITRTDIPGNPDIAPVYTGDDLLAGEKVVFMGQPLFAVAATSFELAQRAVALALVEYEPLPVVMDIKESFEQENYLMEPHQMGRGDSDQALTESEHVLESQMQIKGQEHFYLEGHIGAAILKEDGYVQIFSSSQHPAEVQKLVADVLDLPIHTVQVEVRRMGGGFGGKESQAAIASCLAAIFAVRTGQPVKHRMARRDDMVQTGKRHPFLTNWRLGFNNEGLIKAAQIDVVGDCGCSMDLSQGIVERAMFHSDNAYHLSASKIRGYFCQTNKVSNTAFRGFGGPQGVLACEASMDDVARHLGKDPLDIRKVNLYKQGDKTPYGQEINENVLPCFSAYLHGR